MLRNISASARLTSLGMVPAWLRRAGLAATKSCDTQPERLRALLTLGAASLKLGRASQGVGKSMNIRC